MERHAEASEGTPNKRERPPENFEPLAPRRHSRRLSSELFWDPLQYASQKSGYFVVQRRVKTSVLRVLTSAHARFDRFE